MSKTKQNQKQKHQYKANELAFGDILERASRSAPTTLKVLRLYNLQDDHHVNIAALSRASVSASLLTTTATFLGLSTHDDKNKPIYTSKKKILADHVILKIESHLPQTCQICKDSYTNDMDGEAPLLQCTLCMQGCHNACFKPLLPFGTVNPDTSVLPGLTWLCYGCQLTNNTNITSNSSSTDVLFKPQSMSSPIKTPVSPPLQDLSLVSNTTLANFSTTGTTISPFSVENENSAIVEDEGNTNEQFEKSNLLSSSVICSMYLRNACPHGYDGKKVVKGKQCVNYHPERCSTYCQYGDNEHLGCVLKDRCPLFHPKLCERSVSRQECLNLQCRYIHLKGTKRYQTPPSYRENVYNNRTRNSPPAPHSDSNQNQQLPDNHSNQRKERISDVIRQYRNASDHPHNSHTDSPINLKSQYSHDTSFLVEMVEHMKQDLLKHINSRLNAGLPRPVQPNHMRFPPPIEPIFWNRPPFHQRNLPFPVPHPIMLQPHNPQMSHPVPPFIHHRSNQHQPRIIASQNRPLSTPAHVPAPPSPTSSY